MKFLLVTLADVGYL